MLAQTIEQKIRPYMEIHVLVWGKTQKNMHAGVKLLNGIPTPSPL